MCEMLSSTLIAGSLQNKASTNSTLFPKVREVSQLLSSKYKDSRLGNKKNPLDELAYILLSSQTSEVKYQHVFRSFKARFPHWADVADATETEIARTIY